jgi:hypothetical protein
MLLPMRIDGVCILVILTVYLDIQEKPRLIGNMKVCELCDVSKARKKKISKENTKKTIVPGERVYIDITPIRAVSAGVVNCG